MTESIAPVTGSVIGRTAVQPDAKGLHDLHAPLTRPGTSIPAVALLNPAGGAEVISSYGLGADTFLDEEAKARYRARPDSLEEQITVARDRGDDDRAARLDAERGALVEELRRAPDPTCESCHARYVPPGAQTLRAAAPRSVRWKRSSSRTDLGTPDLGETR
jgi:hypothetical protein